MRTDEPIEQRDVRPDADPSRPALASRLGPRLGLRLGARIGPPDWPPPGPPNRPRPGPRLERWLGTAAQRGVGAVLVLTVVAVLVQPQDPNIGYNRPTVVAGLLGSALLAAVLRVAIRTARPRSARLNWAVGCWPVAVLVSVAGAGAGTAVARLLRYAYGWDAAVATLYSSQLSTSGILSRSAQDYLSRYPNNVPLLALMNTARQIGAHVGLSMYDTYLLFNGVLLAATLFTTFVLVRMLRSARAAFAAQLVVLLLVGASPWMAVPYTDLPAMPLVLGCVAFGVGAVRASGTLARVALTGGAFACAAGGYVVKTTPATSAVALAAVLVLVALGSPWRGRLGTVALLALGLGVFTATSVGAVAASYGQAHVVKSQLDLTRTAPVTWWVANGLTTSPNTSRPYYGSYSARMVSDSRNLRGEALEAWSQRRLVQQVESMGPGGIAVFEVHKQTFNWGDGMFFAWGEGRDSAPARLLDHTPVARAVQSWQHPSGAHYLTRAALTNGVWLFLLLWAGLGLLASRYRRQLTLLALTVLGIAAFTLIFQGRSRYLFAYVPVVVVLAASVDPLRLLRRRRRHTTEREGQPPLTSSEADGVLTSR